MQTQFNNLKRFIVALFFFSILILGIVIHRDYGISWDEAIERTTGIVTLNYIGDTLNFSAIQNNDELAKFRPQKLNEYQDRFFGSIYVTSLAALEQVFQIRGNQEIYFFRHLITFLISIAGIFAIFRLAERRFSDWKIGLLAAIIFILSPKLFADFFYNTKDLVFLAFFAIAVNYLIKLIIKPTYATAVIAAITAALAIDIRTMAIILPALYFFVIFQKIWFVSNNKQELISIACLFFFLLIIFTYAFWPWLWEDPLGNFTLAVTSFSRWVRSTMPLLFMGNEIRSTNLPWFYIPVWIAISTPLMYVILFLIGVFIAIRNLLLNARTILTNNNNLQDAIFISLFFIPIVTIIIFQSVVYDGWRHLYFIYPFFIFIAIRGLIFLWRLTHTSRSYQVAFIVLITLSFLSTTAWMYRAHPYEHIYFNSLVLGDIKNNYEMDYWGLSNREAFEYLLKNDYRPLITACPGSFNPLHESLLMLTSQQVARINIIEDCENAEYIITNFRANRKDYGNQSRHHIFNQIKVDGVTINATYQANFLGPNPQNLANKKIYFNNLATDKLYLVGLGRGKDLNLGWSEYPEAWGIWSDGKEAEIVLPDPKEKLQIIPQKIELNVRAFIAPNHPRQHIQIYINKVFYKNITLNNFNHNQIDIDLPKDSLAKGSVLIGFKFMNAVSPQQLGVGTDSRKLALGLISAEFK